MGRRTLEYGYRIRAAGNSLPPEDLSGRTRLAPAVRGNRRCEILEIITPEDVTTTEWFKLKNELGKPIVKIADRFESWVLRSG